MCAKSPILDPVSKRDNEYKEAFNSIDNMTKRKRKLNNEDKKEVEDTKPKDKFAEAFDVLSKGMEMIDKLTPEEKRKREANLNKYNSNINENAKRKPIKSKNAEDNDDLELDEDKDEEDEPEVVNKPIEKKVGRKKKEVKEIRGFKVNMDEETTMKKVLKQMIIRN